MQTHFLGLLTCPAGPAGRVSCLSAPPIPALSSGGPPWDPLLPLLGLVLWAGVRRKDGGGEGHSKKQDASRW